MTSATALVPAVGGTRRIPAPDPIEAAAAPDRVGRFGRLLHEQVTPGRLLEELG